MTNVTAFWPAPCSMQGGDQAARPWLARVLDQLAAEPALVELIVIFAALAVLVLLVGRVSRSVREARNRSAVEDFLLGVEQACAGEHAGAAKRLARVVAHDPENLQARLVLGEVLRELGRPIEAHSQHLQLQKAFKVGWPRNEIALARSLLDVPQHAAEAVEPARRAQKALPKSIEAARLLFEAEHRAGLAEPAAKSAERLARLLPPGPERDEVLERAARLLVLSAEGHRATGSLTAAGELLARAKVLGEGLPEVRLLEARLEVQRGGIAALGKLLPGASSSGTAVVTTNAPPTHAVAMVGGPQVGAHLLALQQWTPPERHAELDKELGDPELVLDEVEENRSYLKLTIEKAAAGSEAAVSELVLLREAALEELLACALADGAQADVAVRCIKLMGAGIVPALFSAYAKARDRRVFPLAGLLSTSWATIVGRIAQGFGREALPAFRDLLGTEDRDLRKIAVDYHIALADPVAFAELLEQLPPVEVIHRLNATKPEILRGFLAKVDADSLLSELLLVDPSFHRDEELVHALPLAADPAVIVGILERRGYDGDLAEAELLALGDPRLDPALWRVLESYGARAHDHMVSAFADLDKAAPVREQIQARLLALGSAVVPHLCACFGSTPSALDQDLVALLVAIGTNGVEALAEAYESSTWMGRLAATFVGRYTHRRVMIVRTLAQIPGDAAELALRRLAAGESDPNLQMRLAEALRKRPS